MIDAKSLRIGNLVSITDQSRKELFECNEVYFEENYHQVTSLDKDEIRLFIASEEIEFDYSHLEPIPLTEEWLIRAGFVKNYSNSYTSYKLSSRGFTIEFEFRNGENVINAATVECVGLDVNYVHSLQNLYFALTGKELTIKDND